MVLMEEQKETQEIKQPEQDVKTPTITVGNVVYTPSKSPMARSWRRIVEFQQNQMNIQAVDYIDEEAAIIAAAFGRAEITAAVVLDNVPLDAIDDLFTDTFLWYMWLLHHKYDESPNAVTAKD